MNRIAIALSGALLALGIGCQDGGSAANDPVDSGADSGSQEDSGTDSDTDTDTDTDTGTDTDTDTQTDSEWETDSQCAANLDFTSCDSPVPDCGYSICVSGACVAPGCSDWRHNVPGPHFAPPDTGQRLCYGAVGGAIPYPGEGDPLYGQDAQFGWDTLHGADERFARDSSVSGEPVVVDTVTGLAWQGCFVGLSGEACEIGEATSVGYTSAYSHCEASTWGELDDWRLPDEHELVSLFDLGAGSLLDPVAFPNPQGGALWTTSFDVTSEGEGYDYRWCVEGGILSLCSALYPFGALCVRGAPTPAPPRYERNLTIPGEPVVEDHVTGLAWQGCTDGLGGDACGEGEVEAHTWEEALARCATLTWGGFDDWRLPDAKELISIVDHRRHGPAIEAAAFPATPGAEFWSSTSFGLEPWSGALAWHVHFDLGLTDGIFGGDKSEAFAVRCVRGTGS